MISNISIWEETFLEIERPGRISKWIYVLGHTGLEGNDTPHRMALEGMCLSTLWALQRTAFSHPIDDSQIPHEQPLCPATTPPSDNICAVQDTTVIGGVDSTDSSPDDHPGAIRLSLALAEMNEPEEEASHEDEIIAIGLLHCDTSGFDDSKPHGGLREVILALMSATQIKKRSMVYKNNKRRCTNPPPPLLGRGGSPAWPKLPTPALHLGAIHKYQE